VTELNQELSFLLTSAREAAAKGENLTVDPGYVLELFETLEAARGEFAELTQIAQRMYSHIDLLQAPARRGNHGTA
jgi:hypothetical protein